MYMCMHIHKYIYICIPVYVYLSMYIISMYTIFFQWYLCRFYLPKGMANLAFEGAEASEEDLQVAEGEAKAEP